MIQKYSADEARSLKAYGELPESAKINGTSPHGNATMQGEETQTDSCMRTETDTFGVDQDGDCGFEFGDEDASDSEDGKELAIDDI